MVVLTCIIVSYFLLLIVLLVGWDKVMQGQKEPAAAREQLISVIIPVRNEEYTIGKLLAGLSVQKYRNFEIVIVNDHSEDETLWTLSQFNLENLRVINNKGVGKKAALSTAIRVARGSIIVTSDADCSVAPEWLRHIHEQFRNKQVMMVFGGVRLKGDNSFFSSLQEMEFASLIGSGAATAGLEFPTMCSGANLAFRKKAFLEVKGYQDNLQIPSGDDEFLMRKIQSRYPKSIHFLNHPQAVVTSGTESSLKGFFYQRIRWASKWRFNTSSIPKVLAVLIFLIQISFIIIWVHIFNSLNIQALFVIAVKMILEAGFLLQVCRFTATRWNWLAFLALQPLYPLYVISIAAGSFFVPFQWKNRIFKP